MVSRKIIGITKLEVPPRFELGNEGFADLCLTAWLWHQTGAGDEARTRYLHLGKVALYQMSYTRDNEGIIPYLRLSVKSYFVDMIHPLPTTASPS